MRKQKNRRKISSQSLHIHFFIIQLYTPPPFYLLSLSLSLFLFQTLRNGKDNHIQVSMDPGAEKNFCGEKSLYIIVLLLVVVCATYEYLYTSGGIINLQSNFLFFHTYHFLSFPFVNFLQLFLPSFLSWPLNSVSLSLSSPYFTSSLSS